MTNSSRNPSDDSFDDLVLADLVQELTDRLQRGEPVALDSVVERHPQYAERLRQLFPTIQALAGGDPTVDTADAPVDRGGEAGFGGTIGEFRIVREIARGGMGIVYEARQVALNRRVALKVLPFAAALDPRSLARFRQESLAAAQLDHPHIVPVYGVGVDRGVHYYAMRYIEGQSLAQVIAEMAKPASRERKLPDEAEQVAGAMRQDEARDPQVKSDMNGAREAATRVSPPSQGGARVNGSCADPRLEPTIDSVRSAAAREDRRGLSEEVIENGQSDETNPRSKIPAAKPPSTLAQRAAGISTDRNSNRPEYYRGIARLGIQAAEALDYAHAHGVLHRDVKPGNLLIDDAGNVWITDFGLARVESETNLTHTGDLMGTLRYTSPEQALGKRGLVDQRTDVYSLGATLYEVLTLKPVFATEDRAELLGQIANTDPQPLRRFDRSITEELETIVLKCLEKEPADRYSTAQEVADDLNRYLEHRPIAAKRAALSERAMKWSRRHKPVVSAALLVVLVTGLTGLAVVADRIDRRAKATALASEALEEAALRTGEARTKRDDLAAWAAAVAVARRADALAGAGPTSEDLRQRIARLLAELVREQEAAELRLAEAARDRQALVDFDEARVEGIAAKDDGFDFEQIATAYARAFCNYKIDLEHLPVDAAAKRIRESKIRHKLVVAALEWALLVSDPVQSKILEIAQATAANDPPWERPLIRALQQSEAEPLESLAWALLKSRGEPAALFLLGRGLRDRGKTKQAIELLGQAQRLYPGDFWLNTLLGTTLHKADPQSGMALPFFMVAAALAVDSPVAHVSLGSALREKGQLDDAIAEYHRALELKPDFAMAHDNLGITLRDKGQLDDAIAEHRRALELRSDFAEAHVHLGITLRDKGQLDDAIAEYHRALELRSDSFEAHVNLGNALIKKGQLDDAIAEYRRALDLNPDLANFYLAIVHFMLASALGDKGQLDDAIAEYRRALELNPDFAMAHTNLGCTLKDKGQLDDAIAEHRRALELKPDLALAHNNLGYALQAKGQLDNAIVEYRAEIRLNPGNVTAHNNLRIALRNVELDRELPAVLAGEEHPADAAEQVALAEFALAHKHLPVIAAGWYREALAADPNLAHDLATGHRYNAACAAALAATVTKPDELPDAEREAWRSQAREWLTAELEAIRKLAENPQQRAQLVPTLSHWLKDPDLAGIRDSDRLKELPEAERENFEALWRDVNGLLETLAKPNAAVGNVPDRNGNQKPND